MNKKCNIMVMSADVEQKLQHIPMNTFPLLELISKGGIT